MKGFSCARRANDTGAGDINTGNLAGAEDRESRKRVFRGVELGVRGAGSTRGGTEDGSGGFGGRNRRIRKIWVTGDWNECSWVFLRLCTWYPSKSCNMTYHDGWLRGGKFKELRDKD